jgi:hypothetical protein
VKIPIKAFRDDEKLSWEERFHRLKVHHEEETKYLIGQLEALTRGNERAREEVTAAVKALVAEAVEKAIGALVARFEHRIRCECGGRTETPISVWRCKCGESYSGPAIAEEIRALHSVAPVSPKKANRSM